MKRCARLIFVLAVTLITFTYSNNLDEPWWSDESRHLMDGVFVSDFLRELPIFRVMPYVEEYFARFPALGFTWYLPFFAFVEALFFIVFGVGMFAGKATMLAFMIAANVSVYAVLKKILTPLVAVAAVTLLSLHPNYVLWARSIMLEVPSLAMMGLFWIAVRWYFLSPSYVRSCVAGLAGFCMLMTKQTTIVVFIPLLLYVVLYFDWRRIFSLKSAPALLLLGLGLAGIAVHALMFGASALTHMQGHGSGFLSRFFGSGIRASISALWNTYGAFVLVVALAGAVICIRTRRYRELAITGGWALGGILFFALIGSIEGNIARWSILYAPAIFALCACVLIFADTSRLYRIVSYSVFAMLAVNVGYKTATEKHPYLQGFADVAAYVHSLDTERPVLFCCRFDGNFVFYLRQNDPARNSVVLRADKTLVSIVIDKSRGIIEHVSTDKEILEYIRRSGVEVLVLEEGTLEDVPQFERLRALAKTDKFENAKNFRIRSIGTRFDGMDVHVYRLRDPGQISDNEIVIPFPHLGREIRLRLRN